MEQLRDILSSLFLNFGPASITQLLTVRPEVRKRAPEERIWEGYEPVELRVGMAGRQKVIEYDPPSFQLVRRLDNRFINPTSILLVRFFLEDSTLLRDGDTYSSTHRVETTLAGIGVG